MSGIFHLESGDGDPVILLHGFCETSGIWDKFVPLLSGKFRVICPDLPGFGQSRKLKTPFSINEVAADVVQWMRDLKIAKPVLVGHSLGGYVTLAVADAIESNLAGIGLFHSTAFPDTEEKKVNRNKVIDFVNSHGVQPYIDTFVPGLFFNKNPASIEFAKGILSEAKADVLTAYVAAMRDRPDKTGLIARLTKPVLFLCGDRDELIPVDSVQKQAKTAKKGMFKALAATGHMGMLEAPEESALAIEIFASSCNQKPFFD